LGRKTWAARSGLQNWYGGAPCENRILCAKDDIGRSMSATAAKLHPNLTGLMPPPAEQSD
jgi:hypothetical protein